MWDGDARPWDPSCGFFNRVYDALAGKQNMTFAQATVAIQLPVLATYPLGVPGCAFNPSLVPLDGKMVTVVRTLETGTTKTVNLIGEFKDGQFIDRRSLGAGRVPPTLQGHEDLRLFVWQGALWALAAFAEPQAAATAGTAKSFVTLLRIDGSEIAESYQQPTDRYEKNWVPVVEDDVLRVVYATDPLVVLAVNGRDIVRNSLPQNCGTLRGGSGLVPYKDGWLSVVHEVAKGGNNEVVYAQRFVFFDKALTSSKPGKAWYLQKRGVEFVSGLARGESDSFLIGYGVEEQAGLVGKKAAFVAEVDEVTVEELLTP